MSETMSSGLVLDPILPIPLIAVLAAVLLIVTFGIYLRVGSPIGRLRGIVLLLLRTCGVALILLLLLQPSRRQLLPPIKKERVAFIAVDSSLSMKQRDVENGTRFDAVKNLLLDSGVVGNSGMPENPKLRLFEFGDDAKPIDESILDLAPNGKTTRLHKSVTTILRASAPSETVDALVLLSDGHDFELVNPVKTGTAARSRWVPIYAVVLGQQGKVRDAAARITSFQPYCYVKQKTRVTAALRLIGCELEDVTVQLLRQGEVKQTKRLNAGEFQELPVEFEVAEPEVGQYEYEIRIQPLQGEVETANNSAITYLNVIDRQIRVLLVEGDPYWDTTFLQRSLMRNDKFEVDSLIGYGKERIRAIRKKPENAELRAPETLDQLDVYDVVILGRLVDRVIAPAQAALLDEYVKERAGTVIFSRGTAFENPEIVGELQPVLWKESERDRVRLDVTSEGRGLWTFTILDPTGSDALPELLVAKKAEEMQPLTSTLALAAGGDDDAPAAAVVHRRYGRGQVVSVGVEGLWRWGLNAAVEGVNSPFDRFWDQMILWLMAGRDFIPSSQFSFRPNSANILLGEKVHFRVTMRRPDSTLKSLPLTIYLGDNEVGRANLVASGSDTGQLTAEYLPERVGRYRAKAEFPDGSSQESRFIVFTENLEETEVATDTLCLRRLCESSGGRLIEPDDLPRLLEQLENLKVNVTSKNRLTPVWNKAWVFYLSGLLLGLDWFLRRRWGLC